MKKRQMMLEEITVECRKNKCHLTNTMDRYVKKSDTKNPSCQWTPNSGSTLIWSWLRCWSWLTLHSNLSKHLVSNALLIEYVQNSQLKGATPCWEIWLRSLPETCKRLWTRFWEENCPHARMCPSPWTSGRAKENTPTSPSLFIMWTRNLFSGSSW